MLTVMWTPAALRSPDRSAEKGVEVQLVQDDGQLKPKSELPAEYPPEKVADGLPQAAALSKCDGRIYTGIGVRTWGSGAIIEVASGGPADKAGLLAGDILLNPDATEPNQHKAGTRVTLRVLRDQREMTPVVAVIEEVCNEQARPPARGPRRSV
jgi:predicted metalloprotease with PDZ domain